MKELVEKKRRHQRGERRQTVVSQAVDKLPFFISFFYPNFLNRGLGEFLQGNAKLHLQILMDTYLRFEGQVEECIIFFIWIYLAMTIGLLEKQAAGDNFLHALRGHRSGNTL